MRLPRTGKYIRVFIAFVLVFCSKTAPDTIADRIARSILDNSLSLAPHARISDLRARYLFEAVQTGSVRAAAEKLGIVPSAVSRQISLLEKNSASR